MEGVSGVDTTELTRVGASAPELTGQGFDPGGNPNAPDTEQFYFAWSDGAPIGFAGNGGELWRIEYLVTNPVTDAAADISYRFDDVFQCFTFPGGLCPGTPGSASLRVDVFPGVCEDGTDNDTDGLADSPADPGCTGPTDPSEREPGIGLDCDDGDDNDGDGYADSPADPGCTGPTDPSEREPGGPICDDTVDNDGDTLSDSPADPGCTGPADPSEKEPGIECDDGQDNDGDTLIDYPADAGCFDPGDLDETYGTDCDNGVDDDGDTYVDLNDPGCTGPWDPDEWAAGVACDNLFDDDFDGLTDYPADPGCSSPSDLDEHLGTVCDDGFDNDDDTRTDYPADPGCKTRSWPFENPQCQDGRNNDSQAGIDYDGGDSLDLDNNGFIDAQFNPAQPPVGAADPQCANQPWKNKEAANTGCGLGMELALLVPALRWLYRRRRRLRT